MTIIIFVIVLGVLILSHEFGHFIVAKKAGVKVEEFGLGFPPKIFGWKRGETTYSLNLIPFGGFVKIFGENPDEQSTDGPDASRSLDRKPKIIQAAVLLAGIFFNLILAWLLISVAFGTVGLPTSNEALPPGETLENMRVTVSAIIPGSPAAETTLAPGDQIIKLENGEVVDNPTVAQVKTLAAASKELTITYLRGNESEQVTLSPASFESKNGPVVGIGIEMLEVGILKVSPLRAIGLGFMATVRITKEIAMALGNFFADIFRGEGQALSQVTGPVGLAALVGDASQMGLGYLMLFTALISIHLAILNLIPFPALDGGRLLFLIIEAIKGSPIKPKVANTVNFIGFALLLLLMLVVTISDIKNLF